MKDKREGFEVETELVVKVAKKIVGDKAKIDIIEIRITVALHS